MAINHTQYSSQLSQYNQKFNKNPYYPRNVQTPLYNTHYTQNYNENVNNQYKEYDNDDNYNSKPQSSQYQQQYNNQQYTNQQQQQYQQQQYNNSHVQQPQQQYQQQSQPQWNDKAAITPDKPNRTHPLHHERKKSLNDIYIAQAKGSDFKRSPHEIYKPNHDHIYSVLNDNIDQNAITREMLENRPELANYKIEVPYLRYEPQYNNSVEPTRHRPITAHSTQNNKSSFNIIANNDILPAKPSLKPVTPAEYVYDNSRAGGRPMSGRGIKLIHSHQHSTNPILQQHVNIQQPVQQKHTITPYGTEIDDQPTFNPTIVRQRHQFNGNEMNTVFNNDNNIQQATQQRLAHSASHAHLVQQHELQEQQRLQQLQQQAESAKQATIDSEVAQRARFHRQGSVGVLW